MSLKGKTVQARLSLPPLTAERLGKSVLEVLDLRVGFAGPPQRVLVDHLNLLLQPGDRLGLVGPNGAGKTTLLKTLMGEWPPLGGKVVTGKNTQVLSIDQQRTGLNPGWTVQFAGSLSGGDWVTIGQDKQHIASWLEQFLFKLADEAARVLPRCRAGRSSASCWPASCKSQPTCWCWMNRPTTSILRRCLCSIGAGTIPGLWY